jgi:ATP-binding protein involved in chromosome partitioning
MAYTKEQVLKALSHVEEPDLKKDLVTLNMIENIRIDGKEIRFSVVLTTPACPLKAMIETACINAIHHFVDKEAVVRIDMTSRVTSRASSNFPGVRNIIVVASGKGGVGKSTVAANLAVALAKSGAKVGLIDADIYGPSMPIMFKLEHAKPQAIRKNEKTYVIPITQYGIKLLSIGFFTAPGQAIPWRGPMVSSALKQLFNDAEWGELDYLLVDTPPGTGDVHITLGQNFPVSGAVIVTTPQKIALSDTAKGMAMFNMDTLKVPVLGVIENMSYFTPAELPENKYYLFGQGGGKKLAQQFDVPFLGEIPLVQSIGESGENGEPIALNEEHPVAKAFTDIAQKVAQQVAIRNARPEHEKVSP